MSYLSGEAIAGFFFAVGGAAIVLQRVGIIKLPTTRNSKQGNPGNDKIVSLKEVQLVQAEILRQHAEKFDKGDKRFDKLEVTIGKINTNVGILLDRTKK